MRISKVIVVALSLTIIACQNGYRKPSSSSGAINLQKEAENVLQEISNPSKFRVDNCAAYVKDVYQDVLSLSPTRFDVTSTKENWKSIYSTLWQIRVKLRENLTEFYQKNGPDTEEMKTCATAMRDGFRLSRWIEDYLAETFSGEPQDFKAGEPKNQHDPKWSPTPLRGESPWLVVNPKFKEVKIRSGDIIISRGNAYTSSAIARIANIDSQFSHLAFIYVAGDGKGEEYTVEEAMNNLKVLVVESHIEVGSTTRPFKDYIADGNARNLIFRYTGDALMAHRAAKWSYDYVQNYRKNSFDANPVFPVDDVNHNVPYNFQMGLENPQNPKKLFCTQVAHVGFHANNVKIPLYSSQLNNKLSLVNRMGITTKTLFAPGDMEVDPRFEMIAEYRNLRKLKGLRMKDMVLSSMYRMMEEGYELTPQPHIAGKSVFAWLMRQMDVKFTKPQLPKNMNVKILNTTFTLERVAMYLEKELAAEEVRYKKTSQVPMGFMQGLEFLDKVKQKDRELYLSKVQPGFHWDFRPKDLYPPKE